MDKEKNGHLNPAFHLKVVGPINKAGGHKGVSGVFLWQKLEKGGKNCCGLWFDEYKLSMKLTFVFKKVHYSAACFIL